MLPFSLFLSEVTVLVTKDGNPNSILQSALNGPLCHLGLRMSQEETHIRGNLKKVQKISNDTFSQQKGR